MTIAAAVSIVFLLIVLACIAVGLYLIVTSRRSAGTDGGPDADDVEWRTLSCSRNWGTRESGPAGGSGRLHWRLYS